jgi:hypothetical protein
MKSKIGWKCSRKCNQKTGKDRISWEQARMTVIQRYKGHKARLI